MAININKISNANIYVNGTSLAGQADEVTLPAVKGTYNDHKALGLVSAIELPNGLDKMTANIKWNCVYAPLLETFGNIFEINPIQVRANLETHDSSGLASQVPLVVFMNVRFKDALPPITFKQNDGPDLQSELSVTYLRIEIDGDELIEVDVFANIYNVNGDDVLAQFRANLGL